MLEHQPSALLKLKIYTGVLVMDSVHRHVSHNVKKKHQEGKSTVYSWNDLYTPAT